MEVSEIERRIAELLERRLLWPLTMEEREELAALYDLEQAAKSSTSREEPGG